MRQNGPKTAGKRAHAEWTGGLLTLVLVLRANPRMTARPLTVEHTTLAATRAAKPTRCTPRQ